MAFSDKKYPVGSKKFLVQDSVHQNIRTIDQSNKFSEILLIVVSEYSEFRRVKCYHSWRVQLSEPVIKILLSIMANLWWNKPVVWSWITLTPAWAKIGTFEPVTNMYSESTISRILTPHSNFNNNASFLDTFRLTKIHNFETRNKF